MTEQPKKVKVTVRDRRSSTGRSGDPTVAGSVADKTPGVEARADGSQVLMDESSDVEQTPVPAAGEAPGDRTTATGAEAPAAEDKDLVDALQRERAEFANFRKRAAQERLDAEKRGIARLIEELLPVLDTFDAAIAHGEGVELMYKQFRNILETHGLEELPGEGSAFDPTVHHAIRVVDDADVPDEVVREVHQRGYRLGDQVLRAATVTVARPPTGEEAGA